MTFDELTPDEVLLVMLHRQAKGRHRTPFLCYEELTVSPTTCYAKRVTEGLRVSMDDLRKKNP